MKKYLKKIQQELKHNPRKYLKKFRRWSEERKQLRDRKTEQAKKNYWE
jgi:hypothetical protein